MNQTGCYRRGGLLEDSVKRRSSFGQYWRELLNKPQFDRSIKIAELMQRRFIGDLAECISEGNSASMCVLEVGAGSAVATSRLAAYHSGTFYALDIAPEAMEVAERAWAGARNPRVKYVVADVLDRPFPDQSFDLVFSQGLIEHFRDPTAILQAQIRLLKPGGWLAVHVPQKYNTYTLYKHWRMRRGTWPPGWETEYSARELVELGKAFGLRFSHFDGYGSFVQMIVVHVLRKFITMSALVRVVDLFDALEQAIPTSVRAFLCSNTCAYFQAGP